eukprot:COSAG02_NODE_307_length_25111_cov_5.306693_5_plen_92_part_00
MDIWQSVDSVLSSVVDGSGNSSPLPSFSQHTSPNHPPRRSVATPSQDLSFFLYQYWNSVWFSAGSPWFRSLVGFGSENTRSENLNLNLIKI